MQDSLTLNIFDPVTGLTIVDPTICTNSDYAIKPLYDSASFTQLGFDHSADELVSDLLPVDVCICNTAVQTKRNC